MTNYEENITRLATMLKAADVDRDTALNISLRVREPSKQKQMIEWLEQNPEAAVIEICQKSREIHDSWRREQHTKPRNLNER